MDADWENMSGNSEGDSSVDGLETEMREVLERHLTEDIDLVAYSQGDALDVHVQFPELEDTLRESLDGRSVQSYSTLKFTITRR